MKIVNKAAINKAGPAFRNTILCFFLTFACIASELRAQDTPSDHQTWAGWVAEAALFRRQAGDARVAR